MIKQALREDMIREREANVMESQRVAYFSDQEEETNVNE